MRVTVYKRPSVANIQSNETKEQKLFLECIDQLESWKVLPSHAKLLQVYHMRLTGFDPENDTYVSLYRDFMKDAFGTIFSDQVLMYSDNADLIDEFLMNGEIDKRRRAGMMFIPTGFCAKCGRPVTKAHNDHIAPVSVVGDKYGRFGRQILCRNCNMNVKADKIQIDDVARFVTNKHRYGY